MIHVCTLRRLLAEDDGQDLIEYALLSAFIGLAGVAVFSGMGATMQTAYNAWETNANDTAVVEMLEPTGS
jgi:Flp pilus assembly pilin Flp